MTRHAELRALLLDERLGSSHPDPANAPCFVRSLFLDMFITDATPEAAHQLHARLVELLSGLADVDSPRVEEAKRAFFAHLKELAARKQADPGDDVMSRLPGPRPGLPVEELQVMGGRLSAGFTELPMRW